MTTGWAGLAQAWQERGPKEDPCPYGRTGRDGTLTSTSELRSVVCVQLWQSGVVC